MQGALQTSPVSTHQLRAKRHNHEAQSLIPFVLFALPDEASHPLTLGEIITLLNRLDGYVGRQIRAQFCHHPATLQSVLEQLQTEGLVTSTSTQNRVLDEYCFCRVFSLTVEEGNKNLGDE